MKSLHEQSSFDEITARLGKLTPESQGKWGKMKVSQALAHLQAPFQFALATERPRSMYPMKLFGWMFKKQLHNDTPWKQNLPTVPMFKITDEREFTGEREKLRAMLNKFRDAGEAGVGNFPHPAFGTFTKQQWGQAMYKHLDHHLRQFGV